MFLNSIHQKYVKNVSLKLQITVFDTFLSNFSPFLIRFLPLEYLETTSDQCNWSQMKACNVPQHINQKYVKNVSLKLQITVFDIFFVKFQPVFDPFLASRTSQNHLRSM